MNKLCKGKAVQLKQIEEDVEADDDKDLLDQPSGDTEEAKITFEGDDVDDFLDDLLDDDEDVERSRYLEDFEESEQLGSGNFCVTYKQCI